MSKSMGLLLSLVWITACDAECGFFRLECLDGGAPENLVIGSTQSGGIFREFDTEDQYTYIIQTTSHLIPSPSWTTVLSFTGDGQRVRWQMLRCWSATFGGSANEGAWSVQQTSDGGYIVAGYTKSFGAAEADVYLIKTDENGTDVCSKTFGGSAEDGATSVQQTSDGGYIVAGRTTSFGAGANDVYLVRADADGNEVWSRTFGGGSWDYGYSVQQTSDGGYIVAGTTGSLGTGHYADVYLIKTDADGNAPRLK